MENRTTIVDKILAATLLKLLPKKVTPNQLTIFRFITVPFIASLIFFNELVFAIILFSIAALTDALDGALARTSNQITEWGKIYDPMADKLLIGLTGILIIPKYLDALVVVLIILLEMFLIGSAYYLKNKGRRIIQANAWGKTKMIFQSVGVGLVILFAILGIPWILILASTLLYISIFVGVGSIITY